MQKKEYSFGEFGFGSQLIRDLVSENDTSKAFVPAFYKPDAIEKQAAARSFPAERRQELVKALEEQNKVISLSAKSKDNIQRLADENTFCITTGHQLNLLTGPLYSIYKIAQVIAMAGQLEKKYPKHHFVPVFWMATEDHDLEEINHVHLFRKKLSWENSAQNGLVTGRMTTATLESFFDEIEALYQDEQSKEKLRTFRSIYLDSANLAGATRKLMNLLFGEEGLVIIDGDDKRLKESAKSVFTGEVQHEVVFTNVSATNAALEKAGYHQQVFVRNCNLFFIHDDGRRERIIKENGLFQFNGNSYTTEQVVAMIEADASRFSPAALLRPVYEETVLPSLVYVGGGGEIAYWMQLRTVFEYYAVPFPMLRVRDSVFVMNQKQAADLDALGLSLTDLKENTDNLVKKLVVEQSGTALDLAGAKEEFMLLKKKVSEKALSVDKSMSPLIEAEFAKMLAGLEKIESKMIKAEKDKQDQLVKRVRGLADKLFPGGEQQERYDNFLPNWLNDPRFISQVIAAMNDDAAPKIRLLVI